MISVKLIHPVHGLIDQQTAQKNNTKKYCTEWRKKYGEKYFESKVDVDEVAKPPVKNKWFKGAVNKHAGPTSSYIEEKYLIKQGVNYDPLEGEDQPVFCARFGCGKTLSREEALHGRLCINCQKLGRVDIMKVLKFK